jgi:hypothetical protein
MPAPQVILWRILGNDIVPRHPVGQTRRNLEFMLEHEEPLPGCEKRFLLNRIMHEETFAQIRSLLDDARIAYEVIPFEREAYLEKGGPEEQIRYITNVNAARNHCIKSGLSMAPVTLPLDGNCFFNRSGWESFMRVVNRSPGAAAFIIAMWRLRENRHALQRWRKPQVRETIRKRWGYWPVRAPVEPQIGFTRESDALFDEGLVYSKCDKAEVLWRLGVRGPWDDWDGDLRARAIGSGRRSKCFADRAKILDAGFVCRLASGNQKADFDFRHRGDDRKAGLAQINQRAQTLYGTKPDGS